MKTRQIVNNTFKTIACSLILYATAQAADYPAPGDFQKGAKAWADNCGRCHNIRGARELRDDQWISTVYHMRVRAGLTGQESRDILTFLQGSNTPAHAINAIQAEKSVATTTSGKSIYNQTCIACHGADGRGGLPGVPDFLSDNSPMSKSDDILLQNILNGYHTPGNSMAMPPKGGNPNLTQADMEEVLRYIRQVFKK